MNGDFLLERKLKTLDPCLHERYKSSIFAIERVLESYRSIFPTYTDHSILHSMDVAEFCSCLLADQIDKLNADELYVLLMACYLHDSGMGVSMSDFASFRDKLGLPVLPDEKIPEQIRYNHHDLSGLFVEKYAPLFEIPTPEHTTAIVQISRGHRKTRLDDKSQFDPEYRVPNGNRICVPFLASMIRIADEIDVAKDRNISFLFDNDIVRERESAEAFEIHNAIRSIEVMEDCYELVVDASDPSVLEKVLRQNIKTQATIDYCVKVIESSTPFHINQKTIKVRLQNQ